MKVVNPERIQIPPEPIAEAEHISPDTIARRRAVALRIMAMLEDELTRIEAMFEEAGASGDGAFDNRIRALLGVTRALREVDMMSKPAEVMAPDAADNHKPRDVDEFREALARRIESFIAAQQSPDGGVDGGAVD